MSLPDLIEIEPLPGPVTADIVVPGSKSITNRALILAALAPGETVLHGALWSEDTQVMVECLRTLGFHVHVTPDPAEAANRTLTVCGQNGNVPPGGTEAQPLDLFVGNAGTAARFLAAFLCLGRGGYRLHGVPRMHERPQSALFTALRQLGYRIDSPNDRLPALIHGSGPRVGRCTVSVAESSQFASALLLGSALGRWTVEITGGNPEELPYVDMTRELLGAFPRQGGTFQIEPDASSGTYFWAAGWLAGRHHAAPSDRTAVHRSIRVCHWPESGWQIDARFPDLLPLPPALSRRRDLGDSLMMAVVLAADADAAGGAGIRRHFEDLGRLRLQECERVTALRTELTKCGADVLEQGDTLVVASRALHGAEIATYNDHRMAMCFAILGLKVPGLRLQNPACVKKTFPNFFRKLTLPPPAGLGTIIRDARRGTPLAAESLLAD
jgi:3-phosphoshikimate 1-carboxyvinyltransferase